MLYFVSELFDHTSNQQIRKLLRFLIIIGLYTKKSIKICKQNKETLLELKYFRPILSYILEIPA